MAENKLADISTEFAVKSLNMEYFDRFTSNTYAGSGNQLYFNMVEGEVRTGRVFYKIACGGRYNYSILFSNIIDSTFSNGAVSHKNLICDAWSIHSAKIGKCRHIDASKGLAEMTVADEVEGKDADIIVSDLTQITFDGKCAKRVMPGEFFCSDPIELAFEKDEYLCLELTFSGSMIPYHKETLLPVFVKGDEGWRYFKQMPFAGMIGCDRPVKKRIAYLGDSITQGIGTPINSYLHWNAVFSEKLDNGYAFWNLGLGFGKASDAASDGAWLYKAKQNDTVFVCFGVNDILQGMPEEQIKKDLLYIVEALKKLGKTVILQTVPPFNYNEATVKTWKNVNTYIKNELREKVDAVFDTVPHLGQAEHLQMARFGAHPNAQGCKVWAEALFDELGYFFELKRS